MDEDILSQGDDRPASPWRRRVAVIAAVVAVAIGGVVYLNRPHGRPAASAAPSASAIPPAPATLGPEPVASPGFSRLPVGPNGIAGPTAPWEDSLRVPLSGTQPDWFWPATGRAETIGGLPADDAGYQFTRVGDGWAVQADVTSCGGGDCVEPPGPVWFLRNDAQSATPVGTADLVAPAAGAGALWLTSYLPTAGSATGVAVAREVSPDGAPLAPSVSLPTGSVIDQATDRGLLLTSPSRPAGKWVYTLWNPASRKTIRTFHDVIAASATDVAWTSGCAPTCRVQVLDLVTGVQTTVGLPARGSAADGSFSPGGRLLALQLSYGPDGGIVRQLDVASVATGRLTEVTRTYIPNDVLIDFGWPTEGDNLVAEFAVPTIQLTAWHPGASRVAVSALKPGRTQASLIVG
jgi:hypothetical protein